MKKPVLVLLRHADRQSGQDDPGLTPRGVAQAEAIARHFAARFPGESALLLCSPRRRCRETLGPLALALGVPVQDDLRLLEEVRGDSATSFHERIQKFVKWWRAAAPGITVACSHGDWLPIVIENLIGSHVDLEKGAWAEIRIGSDGSPELAELRQSL
ncbi:MAG: phosphoglycerate mutase family protein [Bdellovibrionota bacterium]